MITPNRSIVVLGIGMISASLALGGCASGAGTVGDSAAIGEFCAVAQSSSDARRDAEVDAFYEELEAVAPDEIRDAVATLRTGWNKASFPFGQATLDASEISRPPEVSAAARQVYDFVAETCGTDAGSGVYLIFPEAGF